MHNFKQLEDIIRQLAPFVDEGKIQQHILAHTRNVDAISEAHREMVARTEAQHRDFKGTSSRDTATPKVVLIIEDSHSTLAALETLRQAGNRAADQLEEIELMSMTGKIPTEQLEAAMATGHAAQTAAEQLNQILVKGRQVGVYVIAKNTDKDFLDKMRDNLKMPIPLELEREN